MPLCPRCNTKGRAIARVTLEHQVSKARLANVADADREDWFLCMAGSCEVVYFRDEAVVLLDETRAIPFHKRDAPEQLVCFCFEHSVKDLTADLFEHGTSTIREAIKAACKANRDDCKTKNPQGRCCLGNVGKVLAAASIESDESEAHQDDACCGSSR